MNLLIVSQYFWPENFQINDVAKTLFEKNIAVEILTGKPNYPTGKIFPGYKAWGCTQEEHRAIRIHRVPLISRGAGGWRLALNYLSFVLSGLLFAPFMLRNKKFDAIFVYAPSPILQAIPAIYLGWLKKCPVVLWVQDLWPESLSATGHVRSRVVFQIVGWLVGYIYRHVDLILVQSRAFEDSVQSYATGVPIVYHPNSVDEAFSKPVAHDVPHVTGLDAKFSVLFAGNVGVAQAVEVIVEAAFLLKDYDDIHFVVMGEGSRREWMSQEVRRRNLSNVSLPGRFPVETMPGFMQQASALLVTLADRPIFAATVPSKVQAYLAAGRPILACLNGEGAHLVTEAKAGLEVPAENGHALAEAVLKLYRMSPHEREEMGVRGRLYYTKHFAHEMLVDQLIERLRAVCQS